MQVHSVFRCEMELLETSYQGHRTLATSCVYGTYEAQCQHIRCVHSLRLVPGRRCTLNRLNLAPISLYRFPLASPFGHAIARQRSPFSITQQSVSCVLYK